MTRTFRLSALVTILVLFTSLLAHSQGAPDWKLLGQAPTYEPLSSSIGVQLKDDRSLNVPIFTPKDRETFGVLVIWNEGKDLFGESLSVVAKEYAKRGLGVALAPAAPNEGERGGSFNDIRAVISSIRDNYPVSGIVLCSRGALTPVVLSNVSSLPEAVKGLYVLDGGSKEPVQGIDIPVTMAVSQNSGTVSESLTAFGSIPSSLLSTSRLFVGPWNEDFTAEVNEINPAPMPLFTPALDLYQWSFLLLEGKSTMKGGQRVWVNGMNSSLALDEWPYKANTDSLKFFLTPAGIDDSCHGLELKVGTKKEYAISIDPQSPVTSVGGEHPLVGSSRGILPQPATGTRLGVLSFVSGKLGDDFIMSGSISVKLFLTPSASPMTVCVKVSEVLENGNTYNVRSAMAPVTDKGEVKLTTEPIIWKFRKGSMVRVDVSGTDYPRYDLPKEKGMLTLSIGKKTPSSISLPDIYQTVANLRLSPEAQEEMVNIGFQEITKSRLTYSVSSVKMTREEAQIYSSMYDYLRGKVAGVMVEGKKITIRGVNSINSSTDPLILLDGMVIEDLDTVNPHDVKSVDVLKDAGSAAIYGSRGANGVILITTKSGADRD